MTKTIVFQSGNVYRNTACTACRYNYGRLDAGTTNEAMPGEWGRHASAEKEAFAKDLLQPRNKDGTLNKHFVKAHGTKSIQKEMKLSNRQIRENIERYG